MQEAGAEVHGVAVQELAQCANSISTMLKHLLDHSTYKSRQHEWMRVARSQDD